MVVSLNTDVSHRTAVERRRRALRPTLSLIVALGLLSAYPASAQEANDDATVPSWREEFARDYEYPRDYGHDWRLGSMLGYTPEDGLLVGAGPILYEFGFRSYPYVYRMTLTGGVTIPTLNYKVVYTLYMPALGQRTSLNLYAHASALEIRNFYGYGNDSPRDPSREDEGYYRFPSEEFWLQPTLFHSLGTEGRLGIGIWAKQFRVRNSEGKILSQADLDSLGDDQATLGLGLTCRWDSRDTETFPSSGVLLQADAWHYAGLISKRSPFQRAAADLRFYAGIRRPTEVVLAVRLAGEQLWGDLPFYESAFLGGGIRSGGTSLNALPATPPCWEARNFGSSLAAGDSSSPPTSACCSSAMRDCVGEGSVSRELVCRCGNRLLGAPVFREFLVSLSLASSPEGLFVHASTGFTF